jgi:hypothetical protein
MKDASESTKIINLSQRLDPSSERIGRLLHAVRDIASRRLHALLGNMFEHVDDALFDLAEKAENNATQMHYFDGMREVRKCRPNIERSYLAQVGRELANFGNVRRPAVAEVSPLPSGPLELSLVADNELEESLAITSMISKNESRLSRDLFAVNQRLSVICGGIKVEDASNPVGPALLAQAFRQAMRELPADMRVKLIIYKLFDRYVLSTLEDLYQEINAELIGAGVLPQLRHEIARGTSPKGASAESRAANAVADAGEAVDRIATGQDDVSSELLHTLQSLFSARRGQPAGAVAGGTSSSRIVPTANELLGALSVLQSQIVGGASITAQTANLGSADIAHEVAQLKEHLLAQIGALRGERPSHVSNIDEDTIDLVGMLFEFILEDRNLPAQMQVLLARLQIPYLKAAILDRRLFAHRQHPARRLLDGLAEMAKSWSEESDKDHRLLDKVKSIVDRLLHDFDDDTGIFERLAGELQAFQETTRRRADLAEQRVAESTRGREKLEHARRRAAREILERIDGQALPPLIHGVLARAWANYLVLTLLRQGEGSTEYADALRFVNEFIASTRLGHDAQGRQTLRSMLPGIERALRRGLSHVAFQENDTERLLAHLHTYYRQQLGESLRPDELPDEQASLPIPESVQAIVEVSEPAAARPVAANVMDDEFDIDALHLDGDQLETVMALKPGTWLEFCPTGEHAERAKLSWISPMSGRYLFVNRRGLKVADYAPQELAASLAAGSARLLDSSALFDRAMDAIVGRLSQPAHES